MTQLHQYFIFVELTLGLLGVFLVADDGPSGHERADTQQSEYLVPDAGQPAATDENGAHRLDEIRHGINIGRGIGP